METVIIGERGQITILKEYDNEFVQEMVKSLSLSSDEEKKILKKWTKK